MTNKVAEIRKTRGMSQVQLAEKAKISRVYLSQIETGYQQIIGSDIMFRLAEALDTTVGDIFLP